MALGEPRCPACGHSPGPPLAFYPDLLGAPEDLRLTDPVIRDGSPITIHCPECQQLGTHLGTCSWSQMRSGRVWTFKAISVDVGPKCPSCPSQAGENPYYCLTCRETAYGSR